MSQVKGDTRVPRKVELIQEFIQHFGDGQVATDGVVYSAVATFGTTALAVFDRLINPGVNLQLSEILVGLTQRFTNVIDAQGSLSYYWQMRQESVATTLAYAQISATHTKGVGSLANSEDTLSGYITAGSVPIAPVRIQLVATGLVANSMTGQVKNSSFVKLVGAVIPGV